MWNVVLANVIQLFSQAIEFTSNSTKRRKTTIRLQIASRTLDSLTDALLMGFSGLVVDMADAIRNVLNYRGKLTPHRQFLLVVATMVLIPIVNNYGVIGLLPLLSTTFFTLTAGTKDPFKYKLINAINFLPWVVYDFTIQSYVSMAGDIVSVLLCVFAAIRIKRREDKLERRKARARERARQARQAKKARERRAAHIERLSTWLAPAATTRKNTAARQKSRRSSAARRRTTSRRPATRAKSTTRRRTARRPKTVARAKA